MSTAKVREAVNTHDQLVLAGGGVAIMKAYAGMRDMRPWAWKVYRVDAHGEVLPTGTDGYKVFSWFIAGRPKQEVRAERLQETKDYIAEKFGYSGKWVRNWMGDYVPEDIHKRFPLRPRPKART